MSAKSQVRPGSCGQARSNLGPDDDIKVDSTCISSSKGTLTSVFNCAGILTPDLLAMVLRTMVPQPHDMKKRNGQAVPSTSRTSRQRFPHNDYFRRGKCLKLIWKWNGKTIPRITIPLSWKPCLREDDVIPEESVLEERDVDSVAHVTHTENRWYADRTWIFGTTVTI